MVEESQLDTSTYEEQIQYRIRIDRFTGGVMKTLYLTVCLFGQRMVIKPL